MTEIEFESSTLFLEFITRRNLKVNFSLRMSRDEFIIDLFNIKILKINYSIDRIYTQLL